MFIISRSNLVPVQDKPPVTLDIVALPDGRVHLKDLSPEEAHEGLRELLRSLIKDEVGLLELAVSHVSIIFYSCVQFLVELLSKS